MGGDKGLLREIIQLFIDDLPLRLASIQSAVHERDADGLYKAAHNLKGSASSLSAAGVVEASRALELIGQQGQIDAMDEAWRRLQAESDRLLDALRLQRQRPAPS